MRNILLVFRFAFVVLIASISQQAFSAECYETSVISPSPFMGNNDEVFKTQDGGLWQVKYEYSYLYEYYPNVIICDNSKLVIKGKSLNIVKLKSGKPARSNQQSQSQKLSGIRVVLKPKGCHGYFLADGDSGGIYLLEWFGGYDPEVGDSITGEINSFGFKDVFYKDSNQSGRVWVDDYLLSKSRAMEKIQSKCN